MQSTYAEFTHSFPISSSRARGRTRLAKRFTWNRSSHLIRSDSLRCHGTGPEHASSTDTAVVHPRDWSPKNKRFLDPVSASLPTLEERRHVKRTTAASAPAVCPGRVSACKSSTNHRDHIQRACSRFTWNRHSMNKAQDKLIPGSRSAIVRYTFHVKPQLNRSHHQTTDEVWQSLNVRGVSSCSQPSSWRPICQPQTTVWA